MSVTGVAGISYTRNAFVHTGIHLKLSDSMGMLIRDLQRCEEIIAGDQTVLRELLHPGKESLEIRYSLAHAKVKPGRSSLPHRLKTSEVYYLLEGEGMMHVDGESAEVHRGQAVYIPPNSIQYIENTGDYDLEFLCIVDPAWRPEDEEIL